MNENRIFAPGGDGKIEISQGFAIKIGKNASYPTLLQLLNAKNPLLGIESGKKNSRVYSFAVDPEVSVILNAVKDPALVLFYQGTLRDSSRCSE